ncbi:hypothetical protein KIW84_033512 [Lathyrus oleraceus]|uniref:Reverse transcriptase n=1 Tax=Pisum sativum TaxID=3888 RepID=A0A9D4XWT5_PEA|nr:hypothetical protein KIW84_033512 [Pisum sativum]
MLHRLGFAERWTHWIMMYVTLVHFFVIINIYNVGSIKPRRGLRQGDPVTRYLFILISKGLFALIKGALSRADLHGFQICRGHLVCPICFLLTTVFYFPGLTFSR